MYRGLVTTVLSYCEILILLRSCIQEVCFKGIHSSRYQYKCIGHAHMWRKQGLKRDLFQADVTQIHSVAWNAICLQQILLFSTQNRQRHSFAECRHSTAVSKRRVHLGLWRLGWWRALPSVLSHIYISYQTQRKRERNLINILVNAHVGITDAPLILLSRRSAGQELLEL